MRYATIPASSVRLTLATLSVLAIGFAASGLSRARDLAFANETVARFECRGVRIHSVVQRLQHLSGTCAGKPDGTTCTVCNMGTTNANYLDQVDDECDPPAPPGLKYGTGLGNLCGFKSFTATCLAPGVQYHRLEF